MFNTYDYILWSVISCITATLLFSLITIGIYSLYLMCRSSYKRKIAKGAETTKNSNENLPRLRKVKSVYDLTEANVRQHEELMEQSGAYYPNQESSAHVLFYLSSTSDSGTEDSGNLDYEEILTEN